MFPSSIRTFWSFTHAPSTPLSVLVARATASFTASSKLVSEVALSSVTLATLIDAYPPWSLACLQPHLCPKEASFKHEGQSPTTPQGKASESGVCPDHGRGIHPQKWNCPASVRRRRRTWPSAKFVEMSTTRLFR